jgi:hypothetical protein
LTPVGEASLRYVRRAPDELEGGGRTIRDVQRVYRYLRGNGVDADAIYLRLAATVGGEGASVGGKVSHLYAASAGRAARTEGREQKRAPQLLPGAV